MGRIPRIKSVMTAFPFSIAPGEDLARAQEMMREHGIRHLPVCEQHNVIGILSERDTRVALRVDAQGVPLTVGDVCTRQPFIVGLETPLDEVAEEMARRQIGSALVMRGDKLAGILTTTDVCRLLAETLRDCFDSEDDDVA
ncbi:CBS domain-containing protein [Pseudenhygromyxa sp. WMMC2535]|uniref:CBS domain-containing protein n=1 Tax=Pseudenhygromyxa sp. WMMC2535 TaxID=2712867 RepID=UPI001551A8C6|nr:CBS domain-containing protein [Pseudenhygromyxa sp. WMMC2535]NVB40041.1 CBS domain-containing protein [Pseudenhygromyxa sp. WMMC2535]